MRFFRRRGCYQWTSTDLKSTTQLQCAVAPLDLPLPLQRQLVWLSWKRNGKQRKGGANAGWLQLQPPQPLPRLPVTVSALWQSTPLTPHVARQRRVSRHQPRTPRRTLQGEIMTLVCPPALIAKQTVVCRLAVRTEAAGTYLRHFQHRSPQGAVLVAVAALVITVVLLLLLLVLVLLLLSLSLLQAAQSRARFRHSQTALWLR